MTPDMSRVGGLDWTRRTGGALTRAESRRLLKEIIKGQADYVAGLVKLATGRTPAGAASLSADDLTPPDSGFARLVEEACAEQPATVAAHGYRTWMYGSALATLDKVDLDPELFYAASLLHDIGILEVVPGQDFTLRSADRLLTIADEAGLDADRARQAAHAATVNATAGITVEADGALGVYIQHGAMFDLGGLRLADLTKTYRERVAELHPRGRVVPEIIAMIRDEAKANPKSRFAQLHRCGMTVLLRVNPLN